MRPDGRRPLLRPCQVSPGILNEAGEGHVWGETGTAARLNQPDSSRRRKNSCQGGCGAPGRRDVSPSISPQSRTNRAWLGKVCVRDLPTTLWAENPSLMRNARWGASHASFTYFQAKQLTIKQQVFCKGHGFQRKLPFLSSFLFGASLIWADMKLHTRTITKIA